MNIGNDSYLDGDLELEGQVKSLLADGGLPPWVGASKELNLNWNSNFLGGYDAIKFPRKAENAVITGQWGYTLAPTIATPSTAPNAAVRYDQLSAYVPTTRQILPGTGISGGGPLSSNPTISLDLAYTDARYALVASGGYVRKTQPDVISAPHDFTNPGLTLPDTYGQNLSANVGYVHYFKGANNGASNSFAHHRVWNGPGNTIKVLAFGGDGSFTWDGNNVATQPWVAANYTPLTRALTLNGTAGRISSSAGAQTLAADRTWTLDLIASGVSAGTGTKFVVDTYGRITSIVAATTVSAYGITDVLSQALTGYITGSNSVLTSSNTILTGFQNLQAQISAISFSGYVPTSRTVAVNGTSGRITSSAGAQDLASNRTWTLDLATSGVSASTYRSVTVDVYGRVTAGTNPTTVSSYGITDILSQTLTGYALGSNTAITSANTILGAFQNVQAQINARAATLSGTTGTIAKFTSGSTIGNSILTESGYTLSISGANINSKGLYFPNYFDFYDFRILTAVDSYSTPSNAILINGGNGSAPFTKYGQMMFYGRSHSGSDGGFAFYTDYTVTVPAFAIAATGDISATSTNFTWNGNSLLTGGGTATYIPKYVTGSTFANSLLNEVSGVVNVGGLTVNSREFTLNNYYDFYKLTLGIQYDSYATNRSAIITASGNGSGDFAAYGRLLFFDNNNGSNGGMSFYTGSRSTAAFNIYSDHTVNFSAAIKVGGAAGSSGQFLKSSGGSANTWGGIASGDVTTALTFTPVTNARTITINGTSGRVTSSAGSQDFTNDRTWTLDLATSGVSAGTYTKLTVDAYGRATSGTSLSSGDVTTALTYTPYNSSNPSGYISASGLSSGYFPKWNGSALANGTIQDTGSEINFAIGRAFGVEGAAAFRNDLHAWGDVRFGTASTHGTLIIHNAASATIDGGAGFELRSTTKGIMVSRMTQAERLALNGYSSNAGLIVFQTDSAGAGIGYYGSLGSNAWTKL